jgi:chromosome partitioning protein
MQVFKSAIRAILVALIATVAVVVAAAAGLILLAAAIGDPALKEPLDKAVAWAETWAGGNLRALWKTIELWSASLKPYADVIKPLHDIGAFSAAVLIAVISVLSRHKLKLKYQRIQEALSGEETEPWLFHTPQRYKYRKENRFTRWVRRLLGRQKPNRKTKYICIYNQKGGVGKTTLATNLAAYFDRKRGKKTLAIDLDHQGSLSGAVLTACDIEDVDSSVDELLTENITGAEVIELSTGLQPKLQETRIIPAFLPFGRLENKVMLEWLINDNFTTDIRHLVAKAVRTPEVEDNFDVVIFDCPPRMTTGTVNAICASTHLLLPSPLTKTDTEAIGPTLKNVKKLKSKLNPDLQLLGVVKLTREENRLFEAEQLALKLVQQALDVEGWGDYCIFNRSIPRLAAINKVAGTDIPYLTDRPFRELFDKLGDEIAAVLWPEEAEKQGSPGGPSGDPPGGDDPRTHLQPVPDQFRQAAE